jgi:uncharacterized protein (TIGR02646 family)
MIQLVSKDIPKTTEEELDKLQNRVNILSTFVSKTDKARKLWGYKGGKKGVDAFEVIKTTLTEMCVAIEVCNYCEQNEANDIEHIAPKSFFPEKAFVWDNYLLACKQCNTGYKLDKCHTLDNSGNLFDVKKGDEPIHKNVAFINPRIESPNDFMMLNMETYEFEILRGLDKTKENKALKTLEILKLNERATLIQSRIKADDYFYARIERLIKILNAKSNQDIVEVLTSADMKRNFINKRKKLSTNQQNLKESFKKDIQTHQHPSVWYAIKIIESKNDGKWQRLFEQFPEALNW